MSPLRTPAALPEQRPAAPVEVQELWDIHQVSDYLGVPKQTIYGWRHEGKGPKGFRVGRHLRWHARTVIAWTLGLERDQ
jgi:excisionase family DNA binding protein